MRIGRWFGFVLIPSLGVVLGSGACSRQKEGERCDVNSESDDCESSLVCTPRDQLAGRGVDRCCPPPERTPTDSRCFPSSGAGGSAGTSDAAMEVQTAGTAGAGGAPEASEAAGAECNFNSDCPAALVGGPIG